MDASAAWELSIVVVDNVAVITMTVFWSEIPDDAKILGFVMKVRESDGACDFDCPTFSTFYHGMHFSRQQIFERLFEVFKLWRKHKDVDWKCNENGVYVLERDSDVRNLYHLERHASVIGWQNQHTSCNLCETMK
jgi:hypothetical protein